MPPPNPARPNPAARPGAAPTPTHPTAPTDGGTAGGATGGEAAAYPQGPLNALGGAGAQGGSGTQPEYAPLGNVEPGDVWQLAFWAVTQAASDEESANRRAVVREILMRLVDAIAWQEDSGAAARRGSSHRR